MFKKIISVVTVICILFVLLTACGGKTEEVSSGTPGIDVDISEKYYVTYINEIYTNTEDYLGKTIRLEGMFKDEVVGSNTYHFVYRVGPGCCGNDGATCGFEFVYDGTMPKVNDWIRVTGVLESYSEGEQKYIHLVCTNLEILDERGAETVMN